MLEIAKGMLESKRTRFTGISILLILLFTSFIYYGSQPPRPDAGSYPSEEHIIEDYQRYIDERVNVGGRVIETEPLTIEAKYGKETVELTIKNATVDPNIGDRLSVYGVLKEDHSVEAINSINRPKLNYHYMYAISMVAAVWLAYRIYKQFEWDDWAASPKKRGGEEDG